MRPQSEFPDLILRDACLRKLLRMRGRSDYDAARLAVGATTEHLRVLNGGLRSAKSVLRPWFPYQQQKVLNLSHLLADLFVWYVQDFDIVFRRETDPIDQFCVQHQREEQVQLLAELRELQRELLIGRKSWRDIKALGLEYWPGNLRDPLALLPRLIDRLESLLAGTARR